MAVKAVFELFDEDNDGILEMMELFCGISLISPGSENEKIDSVFSLFDEDGDSFVSMEDMFKFLSSTYKVVLTPNVVKVMRGIGVEAESPEDLAQQTTTAIFKAANLKNDGLLTKEEMKKWFYAPTEDASFTLSPMHKFLQ